VENSMAPKAAKTQELSARDPTTLAR